jgi:hypothetical protein
LTTAPSGGWVKLLDAEVAFASDNVGDALSHLARALVEMSDGFLKSLSMAVLLAHAARRGHGEALLA